MVGQLRTVATNQGWTVIKAFVDRPGAGRPQWTALSRALAAREADLLMVPSFAGIGESVSDVLEEIVRLRDAGCDLYVHDAGLDTTSPIDRVSRGGLGPLRSRWGPISPSLVLGTHPARDRDVDRLVPPCDMVSGHLKGYERLRFSPLAGPPPARPPPAPRRPPPPVSLSARPWELSTRRLGMPALR